MAIATFDRVQAFAVQVPALTDPSSLFFQGTVFDPGEVVGIEVIIPDGVAGLVGFQIAMASQAIIPWDVDTFIVGNNEKIDWSIAGQSNTGDWGVYAYNQDFFPHTLYLRYLIVENSNAALTTAPAALPPLDLSGLG